MTASWVFHRGALGDSVLLWPLLRALRRRGEVMLVTDRSKGRLAARETGVAALDAEQARFNQLWRVDAPVEPVADVAEVVSFASGGTGGVDPVWDRNVRRMFPGAALTMLPGRPDSRFAREWSARGGAAPPRDTTGGPVVLHVGAGSAKKRWPMDSWSEFHRRLGALGAGPIQVIAGEVESEKFRSDECRAFSRLGGHYLSTLDELASLLRSARVVVGADCGPSHLAAQLGVPVLALFGPTDAEQWGPVGPRVRLMAPPAPVPMDWLSPEAVFASLAEGR